VASVQFQLDGVNLGAAVTTAPYTTSWNTATTTNATHILTAVATDVAGNAATSASRSVIVNNATPAPIVRQSVTLNQAAGNGNRLRINLGALTANTLVVAFISAGAPATGTNTTVTSITNQNGLTWNLAKRSNTERGTSEIWWAFSAAANGGPRVEAFLSSAQAATMQVVTFTGAANSLVGAASTAVNAAAGVSLPSASLVTTRANSLVFAIGNDPDAQRTLTAGANQTIVNQFRSGTNTLWSQRANGAIALAGTSVTINASYTPTTTLDRWNLALIEIRTP
jgi:hypothetical protein